MSTRGDFSTAQNTIADRALVNVEGEANRRKTSALYRKSAAVFRWVHIYISMLSFTTLLFFAFTGITLNHPAWFGASAVDIRDVNGVIPSALINETHFSELKVVEHLRAEHRLLGRVAEFQVDPAEFMVVLKAPGYSADVFIDRTTGSYSATESRSGIVAVLNDLHKGRDSGAGWSLVIDVSAGVMMLVSLSGFGLLFYLKKRRVTGVLAAVVGTVLIIVAWFLLVP